MTQPKPQHREALAAKELEKKLDKSFESLKIKPDSTTEEILDLVKKEVSKLNPSRLESDLLDKVAAKFYLRVETVRQKAEDNKEAIEKRTKQRLGNLKSDLISALRVQSSTPQLDNITSPAKKSKYSIPIAGPLLNAVDVPIIGIVQNSKEYRTFKEFQHQMKASFKDFTKALGAKYLGSKIHEERLSSAGKRWYKELSDRFKNGIDEYSEARLQYIFENSHDKETLKANLQNMRDFLRDSFANNDKNKDGILDLKELDKVSNETQKFVDIAQLINSSENDADLYEKLKKLNFFNRQAWKNASKIVTEQFIKDAERNGNEPRFIKAVQKLTGSKKEMDFETASDLYRNHMEKLAGAGVLLTIKAARQINTEINKGKLDILDLSDISPSSIHILVRRQRDMILNREIEPRQINERMIAEFMSTNLVGRTKMLKDPIRRQALFQSIQNIKEHYPRIYHQRYRHSVPRQVNKLSTRSKHPDRPTKHDQIARLLAIITLTKEAEWTIKNLGQTEAFKSLDLDKKLENTEAEAIPPKINLKYRWRDTLYKTGYVSRAVRGGFNARDMLKGGAKIWLYTTAFFNIMNARKHSEGWLKGLESVAKNPMIWGVGALIFKSKEIKRAVMMNEGQGEVDFTHSELNKITAGKISKHEKAGRNRVLSFISSPKEFAAMNTVMTSKNSGNRVRNLLNQIRNKKENKKNKYPVLTREDLLTVFGVPKDKLPNPGNDRIRFLFYERLLTSTRRISTLKANCETWK